MSDLVKTEETRRTITVWSQRDNSSKEVYTDITTWGQFLQQNAQEFNLQNVRGVVRETRHVLEVDNALLPEGNFTLFLFPKKVKSGMKTKGEYRKSEDRNSLRKLCRSRKLSTLDGMDAMAERLAKDDIAKAGEPTQKAPVVHASTKSKAIAPISTSAEFATVEAATVETTMKLHINDTTQLSSLLEATFPNMKVVSINAVVDLTAKLELGAALPAVIPIIDSQKEEEKVDGEVEEVKTPIREKASVSSSKKEAKKEEKPAAKTAKISEEAPSDEQLKNEAADMKDFF